MHQSHLALCMNLHPTLPAWEFPNWPKMKLRYFLFCIFEVSIRSTILVPWWHFQKFWFLQNLKVKCEKNRMNCGTLILGGRSQPTPPNSAKYSYCSFNWLYYSVLLYAIYLFYSKFINECWIWSMYRLWCRQCREQC